MAFLLWFHPAFADDKPWAAGVSKEAQDRALALYRDGNTEFGESRFAQALAKYREAITHWDHPSIRFNIAVSLVNLDQPLEAYDHLERSLKFGEAALGPDAYAQALTYRKLLLGQLATIDIQCEDDDAVVTLDGKPLFTAPGKVTRLVMPGEHQIVATKPGYSTETRSLVLLPGKTLAHRVKLARAGTNVKMVRRWKARTPWIVVAGGTGVALVGGALLYAAKQDYDTYDALVAAQCPSGCSDDMLASGTVAHKDRARIENIVGASVAVVGGAAIVAGLVGVYLNRPRPVEVAPVITGDRVGAFVQWSY